MKRAATWRSDGLTFSLDFDRPDAIGTDALVLVELSRTWCARSPTAYANGAEGLTQGLEACGAQRELHSRVAFAT